jgi:hypothetical protein
MKSNINSNSHGQSNPEVPQAKLASWYSKYYSCKTYQLPDGVQVMSSRQMTLLVDQPRDTVKNYLASNSSDATRVQIPNRKIIQVYPLSVAANYLQKLLDDGDLLNHRLSLTYFKWQQVIRALRNSKLGKGITPNPYFFNGNYRVISASPLQIQFDNNINLEVLVLKSGEYRIEHHEGLKCIKSNPNWLTHHSRVRAKIMSKLSLSPDNVECLVNTESGTASIYALTFEDWLSLWEYFANRGNRRATSILKACALESISTRIYRAKVETH